MSEMKQLVLQIKCIECGSVHRLNVSKQGYEMWQDGALIQGALPELSPSERELLISQICCDCFDKLTKESEE